LVGRSFAACQRIYEPAQHHAPQHRYGQAQYR
jgi:hypothetical protein